MRFADTCVVVTRPPSDSIVVLLAVPGQLPAKDVALYCTGCVRSFSVTEARPHHLFDLIFGQETEGLTLKV